MRWGVVDWSRVRRRDGTDEQKKRRSYSSLLHGRVYQMLDSELTSHSSWILNRNRNSNISRPNSTTQRCISRTNSPSSDFPPKSSPSFLTIRSQHRHSHSHFRPNSSHSSNCHSAGPRERHPSFSGPSSQCCFRSSGGVHRVPTAQ